MNESILRELKEDIRRDELAQLWKRHGGMLIALCAAIVLGTAGGVAWKHYRAGQAQQRTTQLLQAVRQDAGGQEAALRRVIEDSAGTPQAALADLRLAQAQREAGQGKEALATYLAVAEDTRQEASLRTLAGVLAVHTAAQHGLALPELRIAADSAFAATAREAEGWRLYGEGKTGEALAHFQALADNTQAPPVLRQRMDLMIAHIGTGGKPVQESEGEAR